MVKAFAALDGETILAETVSEKASGAMKRYMESKGFALHHSLSDEQIAGYFESVAAENGVTVGPVKILRL